MQLDEPLLGARARLTPRGSQSPRPLFPSRTNHGKSSPRLFPLLSLSHPRSLFVFPLSYALSWRFALLALRLLRFPLSASFFSPRTSLFLRRALHLFLSLLMEARE